MACIARVGNGLGSRRPCCCLQSAALTGHATRMLAAKLSAWLLLWPAPPPADHDAPGGVRPLPAARQRGTLATAAVAYALRHHWTSSPLRHQWTSFRCTDCFCLLSGVLIDCFYQICLETNKQVVCRLHVCAGFAMSGAVQSYPCSCSLQYGSGLATRRAGNPLIRPRPPLKRRRRQTRVKAPVNHPSRQRRWRRAPLSIHNARVKSSVKHGCRPATGLGGFFCLPPSPLSHLPWTGCTRCGRGSLAPGSQPHTLQGVLGAADARLTSALLHACGPDTAVAPRCCTCT
jgi:hypothetical protein